jgi:osmotically-inducible protein OsmY
MTITAESTQTIADRDLRSDVEDELEWDRAVPSANIGVSVTDHTVTVSGTVHTLHQRLAAVKAARRVKGVHAIVDEIVVVAAGGHGSTDQDIALAIERILEHSSTVPAGVTATVRDGVVTLAGSVSYQFQKNAAYKAARDVKGVTWVDNDIVVMPEISERVIRSKIVGAMHRNADLDSRNIQVVTTDHEVWLGGYTRSYAAKAQAEFAAWSAPGVAAVHNNILLTVDT